MEPPRKIDALRAAMAAGDWRRAFSIAARFPRLGGAKAAIVGGHEAMQWPGFQRQLGRDPEALVEAGKAALRARYGGRDQVAVSPTTRQAASN